MAEKWGQLGESHAPTPATLFDARKADLRIGILSGAFIFTLATPAWAEQNSKDDLLLEMKRQIQALQRRVEELESEHRTPKTHASAPKSQTAHASKSAKPKTPTQPMEGDPPEAFVTTPQGVAISEAQIAREAIDIPGLLPPEPMGTPVRRCIAVRLPPGLSFRIPGASTEVRFYGFAKGLAYTDLNGRNQTDAPASRHSVAGSPADMQGGDFGLSARFSRVGMDTRTTISWGTFETRLEGDFGGGGAGSLNKCGLSAPSGLGRIRYGAIPGAGRVGEQPVERGRLRNRKLRDQPQSVLRPRRRFARPQRWPRDRRPSVARNAGHTIYVRRPAYSRRPAPPPVLQASARHFLPCPICWVGWNIATTAWTSTYAACCAILASARRHGVGAPTVSKRCRGWRHGGNTVRLPMRWMSEGFGPDQSHWHGLLRQGIGRYFGANTSGQDALSNIGLPGDDIQLRSCANVWLRRSVSPFLDTTVRSNLAYSYA